MSLYPCKIWWTFAGNTCGQLTQPLAALLVMGMAGYRLAPRKQPEHHANDQSSQTPQTITEEPAENGLSRLQRHHFAGLFGVLVFFGWTGVSGLWNDHFIRTFFGRITKNNAGEITNVGRHPGVTDAGLVHLEGLTNLQSLHLSETQITDAVLVHLKGLTSLEINTQVTGAGLVHLKGVTNLQSLNLNRTQVTDAGVAELKQALPDCKIEK